MSELKQESKPNLRHKHQHLLSDPNIKRWFDNIARGSIITAEVYLRRLGYICSRLGTTPQKLAGMSEEGLYTTTLDAISMLESEGKAGSYIEGFLKSIKSWGAHNGIFLRRRIKIKGVRDTPTLRDERVPTQEELKRIFMAWDRRARAACALVAHSGLRLQVLGNFKGRDGLRVGDIPELIIENGRVEFRRIPAMVVVRKELSKAGHQYFTFLGREGCMYLKDYLEGRMRAGERLTLESPIIRPKKAKKPFIRTIKIGDIIRRAIRSCGLPWRPYVLRSYFDTQLMLAESKGLIIRDYRQFFMGHKGDIENKYTTNKCRLPEKIVEDMRSSYAKCLEYLETDRPRTSQDDIKIAFRKQILLAVGFKPTEVEKMDLSAMDDETLHETIRQRLAGVMIGNGQRQKVVPVDDVEIYIAEGWEFVAALPNGKAVVKMPF